MRTQRTNALTTAAVVVAAALLLLAAAACGGDPTQETPSSAAQPSPAGSAPPAGTKLAAGLYDLADRTVQAVGTVEYRDLEGGFWAVIGGTNAEGNAGTVVAVTASGADYADQFTQHGRLSFIVDGTRLDGASTRMAGPEITATRVPLTAEDVGPAEQEKTSSDYALHGRSLTECDIVSRVGHFRPRELAA